VDTDDVVSEPNIDVVRPKRLHRAARIAASVAIVLVVVGAVVLVITQPWNRAEPVASPSATRSIGATPTKTATATPSPTASAHVIGTVTMDPNLPPAKPLESGLLASAGEGWNLVSYSSDNLNDAHEIGPQILYLVSPDGDVYEARNLGTSGDFRLADWAPGSSRVLLERGAVQAGEEPTLEVLDLETGASVGSFTLPTDEGTTDPTFTRPTGQNVVVSTTLGANGWLRRYSPTGQQLATLLSDTDPNLPPDAIINFHPTWIYGQDGTFAVVSYHGLRRISSDGATTTMIPLPAGTVECWPTRWWDASRLLARCDDDLGPNPDDPTARRTSSNMWLISMTGQAPERLSSYVSKDVVDFGITNVWDVAGTRYAQWSGDCGGASFGVLDASGKYTTLTNSVTAVGSRGATFAATYNISCGDPGRELVFVNGSDGSTRMILPRVGHAVGVLEVVAR